VCSELIPESRGALSSPPEKNNFVVGMCRRTYMVQDPIIAGRDYIRGT